jgi:peptide/nickel transport system ATP-binding protein
VTARALLRFIDRPGRLTGGAILLRDGAGAIDIATLAEASPAIRAIRGRRIGLVFQEPMSSLSPVHTIGAQIVEADAVAVMRFGRIVEHGTVDDIFYRAAHPYTRRLLDATRRLDAPGAGTRLQEGEPVLSVRGLGKTFDLRQGVLRRRHHRVPAVRDASFDLYPGENLGTVGESGSGKTTLGRLILRIVEPSAGSVTYRGREGGAVEIGALDQAGLRAYRHDVRLVFQDPFASLNPRLTVKDVIGDPLRINGIAEGRALAAKVAELMRLVGLDPAAMERFPHAFFGGQRQRIGIARALALGPRIIIADEATSALDVSIRSQILDLLLDLQKRLELSFLFISHDIAVIRYFCHRVAVMHRGRIVEIGDAAQICTAPREPYTRSLISAVPSADPSNKRMLHRHRFTARALRGKHSHAAT